jgi:hypothetical protein
MSARWTSSALLLAGALWACGGEDAGTTEEMESDEPTAEAEDVPSEVTEDELSDWSVRLDSQGDPSGFQLVDQEEGFTITTGPAGIAWRATDLAREGDFTVSATFTQREAPASHREAFGIFVGGRNLESPDQVYTYFLIRGTGEYLLKGRDGSGTSELAGWSASPAVHAIESDGAETTNTLTIAVQGDSVTFSVNGTEVASHPKSEISPYGFAGVRVNHRLDVAVQDWSVTGSAVGQGD